MVYLWGGAVVGGTALLVGVGSRDRATEALMVWSLAAIAGLLWPVLALGAVQLGAIAVVISAARTTDAQGPRCVENERREVLDTVYLRA